MILDLIIPTAMAFLALRRRVFLVEATRREWFLVVVSAGLLAYWQPFALLAALALTFATWAALYFRRQAIPPRLELPLAGIVASLLFALALLRHGPALFRRAGLAEAPWPVPLGVSFLVFRLVGVAMDARAFGAPVGLRQLLLLALFFPTYRSGPITTLRSLEPLPAAPRDPWAAFDRILLGLARKYLLADLVSAVVVRPWLAAAPDGLSPEQCLLFPFALGLWVYWDFAGYSDIAIGTAALLGYRVPENFDRPYLSRNIMEFWRRWHMSLSEWLRLRVFMKLTGRRPSSRRVYGAAILTMLLCGLWHGPDAGFLVWGLWHGFGMATILFLSAAERRHPVLQGVLHRRWAAWTATALTYVYVNIAWLPFFLPMRDAWKVNAKAMTALTTARGPLLLVILAGALLLGVKASAALRLHFADAPVRGIAYAVVFVAAIVLGAGAQGFVYFRF